MPSFGNVPSVSSDDFSVSTSVPNKTVWAGNFIRSVCLARHRVASYLATFTLRLVGGFGWGFVIIVARSLLSIRFVVGGGVGPYCFTFIFRILDRNYCSGLWDASNSLSSLRRRSSRLAMGVAIGYQGEASSFRVLAFAIIFVATSPLFTFGMVRFLAGVGVLTRIANMQLP